MKTNIIRLPFFRFLFYDLVILLLLFTKLLNVFNFFFISIVFFSCERILEKKKFNKKIGNKFIDYYGMVLITILTMAAVLIVLL